ncbi:MAG TPA: hypothetical protein VG406_08605 [Isosphaeraceae bacterium]|jgi:hypothetical protein|nr:hypothetical protein [Isosphaeraceae bacterium]
MRRDTARTTKTRTTPRLEALDDRALPSGMAGAQMMAAIQEHRAALQQRRELRLEAQQQRRELRLEALQQRQALHGQAAMASTIQFQGGLPPFFRPTSIFPVKGAGSTVTTPIASAPVSMAPVVAAPVASPSPSISSPVMAPAAPAMAAAPATAADPSTAGAPQPVPKADPHLNAAYEDFLASNGGDFTTSQSGIIEVVGTSVGVDVHGQGGAALASELSGLGMTVQTINGPTGVIEGLLPLAELPTAANLSGVAGISAIYIPKQGMIL